ncbi:MAG: hypothetical protein IIW93_03595, partial [Bacteroidaceae bacterium]|nr:hypothetical protein [Bacteroidaceae bacterium]
TLSKGIPHVRVDFYEVDGQIYFGELTLYHWSGLVDFEPNLIYITDTGYIVLISLTPYGF